MEPSLFSFSILGNNFDFYFVNNFSLRLRSIARLIGCVHVHIPMQTWCIVWTLRNHSTTQLLICLNAPRPNAFSTRSTFNRRNIHSTTVLFYYCIINRTRPIVNTTGYFRANVRVKTLSRLICSRNMRSVFMNALWLRDALPYKHFQYCYVAQEGIEMYMRASSGTKNLFAITSRMIVRTELLNFAINMNGR